MGHSEFAACGLRAGSSYARWAVGHVRDWVIPVGTRSGAQNLLTYETDALPLRIVSENPLEQIWTQLSLWESTNLARKVILDRADVLGIAIDPGLLKRKALALSYCIRTSRENIRNPFGGLTVGNICNYYGCMWLAAATLAADPSNDIDLGRLEEFTKRGHGLGNIAANEGAFPDNEFLYVRESGFFREFLKASGVDRSTLMGLSFAGGRLAPVSEMDVDQRQRLLPLDGLLARIPELASIYEYVTGRLSMTFGVHHSSRNMREAIDDAKRIDQYSTPMPTRRRDYTWLSVSGAGLITEEHIRRNGPPLQDIERSEFAGQWAWRGKLPHPSDARWYDHIALHKSAMTGTCWIKPMFAGVNDVLALHLVLLYALSILARYRPAVWREVIEGELDQYRSLIAGYHDVFQRVVPELALKRISDRPVAVTQPGSFFAPL